MNILIGVTLVVAATAAFRSTWSPCGLSMLSTVTPMAEVGRGHRYRWTASWFFVGALVGGATTGAIAALGAVGVRALDLSNGTTYAVAAAAAILAASIDGRLVGPPIPHHRRQVNEDWLGRYRAWVYGSGFGWQIGTGLATYIMTAGVYLVIVLSALTAQPLTALLLCVAFGGFRGSMVLLGARLTSTERLAAFHERFEAWREPVRRAVIAIEVAAAAVLAVAGGAVALIVAAAFTVLAAIGAAVGSIGRDGPKVPADACSIAERRVTEPA